MQQHATSLKATNLLNNTMPLTLIESKIKETLSDISFLRTPRLQKDESHGKRDESVSPCSVVPRHKQELSEQTRIWAECEFWSLGHYHTVSEEVIILLDFFSSVAGDSKSMVPDI